MAWVIKKIVTYHPMLFPRTVSETKYQAVVDGMIKEISIQDYAGKYIVVVFYPLDFTFVCPTEINRFSELHKEFKDRDAVVLLVSCDSVYSHLQWSMTPRECNGVQGVYWPMVSDMKRGLCQQFGLFDEENGFSMRSTVILGKDLSVKHLSANFHAIGRSVKEVLRLLDAIAFNDEHGEICVVEWNKNNKEC